MASIVVQVRVDEELKDEAQAIYEQLGLDLPSAIRMFLKKSVIDRGLPFRANLDDAKKISLETGRKAFYALREEAARNGIQDMSLDEINAEIKAAREEH